MKHSNVDNPYANYAKGFIYTVGAIAISFWLYVLAFACPIAPMPAPHYLNYKATQAAYVFLEAKVRYNIDKIGFDIALNYEEFDMEYGDQKLILLHELAVNLDKRDKVLKPLTQKVYTLKQQIEALEASDANTIAARRALLAELIAVKDEADGKVIELKPLEEEFNRKILELRDLP
ncbi:MAG: hypothetical protein CMF62_08240 [Magnetococcales bacterium]|nr:hypothetical protein [Magnetococcales bacterium]